MQRPLVPQAAVGPEEDAERRARFPLGAALRVADLEDAGREGAVDDLRASEPVSWVPALGCWLVTGHAAAREVLGPATGLTVEAEPNLVRASLGEMMLTTDGDEHTRLRAPFARPFRMREVEARFRQPIAQEADGLVRRIAPRGACELGRDFAAPYAVGMAGRVLGLSLGDTERIDGFYAAFAGAMVYDGDPAPLRAADAARAELDAILHGELARCRREPDGSITSQVANDPERGLDDAEIVAQLRVIMFGAIETIQAAVMSTLLLLLRHPDALAAARRGDDALAAAVDEAVRLVPPVAFMERWTRADVVLGGVELGPGEFVGVSVLGTNRDPAVFDAPLRFDPGRPNARLGLGFSFGAHHCLGSHLARIEVAGALRRLLDGLPGLAPVDWDEPSGFVFRRPATLHLDWDA